MSVAEGGKFPLHSEIKGRSFNVFEPWQQQNLLQDNAIRELPSFAKCQVLHRYQCMFATEKLNLIPRSWVKLHICEEVTSDTCLYTLKRVHLPFASCSYCIYLCQCCCVHLSCRLPHLVLSTWRARSSLSPLLNSPIFSNLVYAGPFKVVLDSSGGNMNQNRINKPHYLELWVTRNPHAPPRSDSQGQVVSDLAIFRIIYMECPTELGGSSDHATRLNNKACKARCSMYHDLWDNEYHWKHQWARSAMLTHFDFSSYIPPDAPRTLSRHC